MSCGYRVTGVGERGVNEAEAAIIRRIFREYASGASPRVIARTLNAEAISGPRGRAWGPLRLVGQKSVGNGLLNDELYIGRMIWNRPRWIKDPDTHKRLSRRNPPGQWIRLDVPNLRIIDDELWKEAKARQKTIDAKPFSRRAWPKHLLSGLVKYGLCGGGMSNVGGRRGSRGKNRRSLIERIVVAPGSERATVELIGDLGGILTFASEGQFQVAAALGDHPSAPMVAGLGFEPRTFRL